jgi:hypothetical protein
MGYVRAVRITVVIIACDTPSTYKAGSDDPPAEARRTKRANDLNEHPLPRGAAGGVGRNRQGLALHAERSCDPLHPGRAPVLPTRATQAVQKIIFAFGDAAVTRVNQDPLANNCPKVQRVLKSPILGFGGLFRRAAATWWGTHERSGFRIGAIMRRGQAARCVGGFSLCGVGGKARGRSTARCLRCAAQLAGWLGANHADLGWSGRDGVARGHSAIRVGLGRLDCAPQMRAQFNREVAA